MTEKEISWEFKKQIGLEYVYWEAPRFKIMRWDIFGVFDFILVNKYNKKVEFVQITTLSNLSHRRKKIKAFFHEIGIIIPASFIYAWDKKVNKFRVELVSNF